MSYRSISVEGFQWKLRKSAMTPLASNYILLAYSERQIIRSRPSPYKLPRSMLRNPRYVEVDKGITAIIEELFGRPRDLSSVSLIATIEFSTLFFNHILSNKFRKRKNSHLILEARFIQGLWTSNLAVSTML